MMYDKAYDLWDFMDPKERIDWCESVEIELSEEESLHDANWISINRYCLWTTIRDILIEL